MTTTILKMSECCGAEPEVSKTTKTVKGKKITTTKTLCFGCKSVGKFVTKLNPRMEMFCRYFATNENDTIGNATRAYMGAYGIDEDNYFSAGSCGYRLLKNVDIQSRLKELWKQYAMGDEEADAMREKIIRYGKDQDALSGLRDRDKVKGRIMEHHDIEGLKDLETTLRELMGSGKPQKLGK